MLVRQARRSAKHPLKRLVELALTQPRLRDAVTRPLIEDDELRAWLVHRLGIHQADFDAADAAPGRELRGFEDCYWLFSSNELNYGLSQLRLDEAAHLYRLLRGRRHPRVAELGRFKGGTTFLMAAAGARVVALDNDQLPGQAHHRPALQRALERHGLAEQVQLVDADAYRHPVEPESFDLVLVHCSPQSATHARLLCEHWWPAVTPGGHLVLHATPHLPGVVEFVTALEQDAPRWGGAIEPDVPGENVFFRKSDVRRSRSH